MCAYNMPFILLPFIHLIPILFFAPLKIFSSNMKNTKSLLPRKKFLFEFCLYFSIVLRIHTAPTSENTKGEGIVRTEGDGNNGEQISSNGIEGQQILQLSDEELSSPFTASSSSTSSLSTNVSPKK